jgi:hypothetical protein
MLFKGGTQMVKLCVYKKDTVSFKDLDLGSEMIIYESILTTFEVSFIFLRQVEWNEKLAQASNQTTIDRFSLPKLVKHTVSFALKTLYYLFRYWVAFEFVFQIKNRSLKYVLKNEFVAIKWDFN